MNQTKNTIFSENYNGILTHDGWVKVAKFNITAKILNIQDKTVTVKNSKKSYNCDIHKNLLKDVVYMEKGDLAGIKWNMGKPYVVVYQKQTAKPVEENPTGDAPTNTNWIYFYDKMELWYLWVIQLD